MTDRSPLRPVVLCLALGLPALAPAAAHEPPEEGATALLQGDRLSPEERRRIASRLSELTGLSVEYLEATDLRVEIFRNYAEHLRRAMHENPYLQVLVMSGYYDLATPYFASDYTVTHMSLDEAVRDNVRAAYFEAGHMMYVREESLAKFREEYLRLIRDAGAPRQSAGPPTAGAAR
jgi:carboxypeptidase C (cathepsin A)